MAEDVRYGGDAGGTHALWEDDITVRLTTEPVMLAAGKRVTHRYLVYNGPVKPSLLGQLRGERQVDPQLIDRYVDTLKLNTLTDYPSPGPLSAFSSFIGWTWLIIKCTNLMHWVLGKMTLVLPSYGLSIILLTLLVRLAMFPLSRKQALMTLKMSALQPELKKLAAKYKDDKQAYAQAQMALFRQHGVNPFGSCWILLLQMPIFMGLYFALQESIQFRLAAFWPTWITNLAAPDMMFEWGRRIPLLSNDAAYGGMLYLGPYFNLLPIITVALMLAQQKMMTPPPADAEQEMQQKMMRIMMVVFGLFFYRLASGLCLYIIVSTLWGFAERKLLPKAQTPKLDVDLDRSVATLTDGGRPTAGSTAVTAPSPVTTGKKPGKTRRKDRGKGEKETPSTKFGQMRQRLSDWWTDLLEQARKK
ncbi:MAG: YidC/Oxa1 family membrane protein insertase [Gemmataceae bacterium]